jgi:hypothetical protein
MPSYGQNDGLPQSKSNRIPHGRGSGTKCAGLGARRDLGGPRGSRFRPFDPFADERLSRISGFDPHAGQSCPIARGKHENGFGHDFLLPAHALRARPQTAGTAGAGGERCQSCFVSGGVGRSRLAFGWFLLTHSTGLRTARSERKRWKTIGDPGIPTGNRSAEEQSAGQLGGAPARACRGAGIAEVLAHLRFSYRVAEVCQ